MFTSSGYEADWWKTFRVSTTGLIDYTSETVGDPKIYEQELDLTSMAMERFGLPAKLNFHKSPLTTLAPRHSLIATTISTSKQQIHPLRRQSQIEEV